MFREVAQGIDANSTLKANTTTRPSPLLWGEAENRDKRNWRVGMTERKAWLKQSTITSFALKSELSDCDHSHNH